MSYPLIVKMAINSNPRRLGIFGERIAVKYLQDKGYIILDKNYFKKEGGGPNIGEVDVVVKKNDIISFIEVKTLTLRGPSSLIAPEEKVNFLKQRKIIKTAQSWLSKNRIPLDTKWQIDIISIKVDLNRNLAKVRHFENAISL